MIQNNWMIADLHIHSRFSRACSSNINFENLVKWAKIKGLNILGTGDFTHPIWFEEIKKLKDNGKGFYYFEDFPFVISGEISLMYSDEGNFSDENSVVRRFDVRHHPPPTRPNGGEEKIKSVNLQNELKSRNERKGRRIHLVILVPSIEIAEKINFYFDSKGRRDYDGRPIFKIPGDEFVRDMGKISTGIEIIPAHAWTPWFGIFGSMSGFDLMKDCFKEQFENVHAIETGMSSDPEMNWKIKELETKSIVSFSDAHSFWPFRLGREATIFKKTDSYRDLILQIRKNDFIATIETDPAYGKYHWDGHRNCNFSCPPEKTKELNGICPVCKTNLTIGVENRVEELSDKSSNHKIKKPFYKFLPLHEVIALSLGTENMQSKKVWDIYNALIKEFENEFNILLSVSKEEMLKKEVDKKLTDLILKNREGMIKIKPGFDGEYGKAILEEIQKRLF